jgi:hypothetical protein
MTLMELEDSLPSGLHDSALKGLSIDYVRRTIRLDVSLKVGDADGPREQRDEVRNAQIEISGVVLFVIDPPSPAAGYDFKAPGELWIVDGYETRSIPGFTTTIDKELLDAVPPEALIHSFFVSDWNSYMHVAARDCSIKWVGAAEHYRGRRQAYYPGETIDL